ncbi:MAG: tagaturonate reductase [Bacteroidetes bacterium]|nr:tagaturonate reductase [Bacteroidota bacterium]MBS1758008.1 tagaturonate reductase [Bacteroidota bacterium]
MMKLSKAILPNIKTYPGLVLPDKQVFDLPEKILQFGTGVLLRGLPDFIFNEANNQGLFNGRIVVVKSTGNGSTDHFVEQDGLYTVCVRGIQDGVKVSQDHVVATISRVLSAMNEWDEVLQCAANPHMQLIISNTTEVGIALVKENIHADPPLSFPGKLLSFLYHRYKFFNADPDKGMVIVPTELIPFNGDRLLSILLELAHFNNLESAFLDWLENSNCFCNSLVDRIVPGKLNDQEQKEVEKKLDCTDELMIKSEIYSLWAIQSSSSKVKELFSFASENSAVIICDDIEKYRELKLRLLNGSHTFTCAVAFLAGFDLVRIAMQNEDFKQFIEHLMYGEMIPAITSDTISTEEATKFANNTLDRYRNVFIDHHWLSITAQFSYKMNLRNSFIIENYIRRFNSAPTLMAFGMASFLLFMRCKQADDGKFYGNLNGNRYFITDDNAPYFSKIWEQNNTKEIVDKVLSNENLFEWGSDIAEIFKPEVVDWLDILLSKGVEHAIQIVNSKNVKSA